MKKLSLENFKENAIKSKALFTIKGGSWTNLNGGSNNDNIDGDYMYVADGNGGTDVYCRIGNSNDFGGCPQQ